jgi:uncharacterized OsmC-like protein
MAEKLDFSLELEQLEGYEFKVRFDWPEVPELLLDEPEPLGHKRGPNAARLVAAAVANCLSASLVFCLKTKFKGNPKPIRSRVTGQLAKNERGRYRIGGFQVTIDLGDDVADIPNMDRCREQFEDFCIVTESIRHGIPVSVRVLDASGQLVHESSGGEAQAV